MGRFIRRVFIAIQFLTRLPVPRQSEHSEQELGKAAAFFPLVGALIGGGAALVFILISRVLPLPASILCAIAFASLATNAFHEDGLADAFDGFGGAWTKQRTLEIMRDSRIGSYGAVALIFLILGKQTFLSGLPPEQVWRWLIVGHTASRWTTLPLCRWLPYARDEGQGKLVARQVGPAELLIGSVTFLLVTSLLSWPAAAGAVLVAAFVTLLCGYYFRARLGGITGDCLGAANQLTEVAVYLAALVALRFKLI